jgi:hypothetical protein
MKNMLIMITAMALVAAAFATAATTVKTGIHNDRLNIYCHFDPVDANDDFNDVNTLVYSEFYGDVLNILIDANGADANGVFDVDILIDPREFGESQIEKLYTIKTFADVNVPIDYFYPIAIATEDPNYVADKPTLIGDLYIGLRDMDPNIDDIKIYLNCKMK